MRRQWITFVVAMIAVNGAGCASSRKQADAAGSMFVERVVIGQSIEGRPIEAITLGSGGPPAALFIATIHGSEPAGTPLLERLARELHTNAEWMAGHSVMIVPLANPDGFAASRRGNSRGVDLNRNFPSSNFRTHRRHGPQPLSEPESQALHALLMQHRPRVIVSIHQPIGCIDYDGPAEALAVAMAAAVVGWEPLPVRKLGAQPGSLGAFAGGDLGIPIITLELPGDAHRLDEEELWARYGPVLLAAIDAE